MSGRKLRLGIDVGGTFTDVVAIDAATRELIARVKVPTTHDAPEGVAAGIVDGVRALLERTQIAPDDVAFIAHSTTQATNALLEGDVANVGVVGLLSPARFARGADAHRADAPRRRAPSAPQRSTRGPATSRGSAMRSTGCRRSAVAALAASEAFGVDRPRQKIRP